MPIDVNILDTGSAITLAFTEQIERLQRAYPRAPSVEWIRCQRQSGACVASARSMRSGITVYSRGASTRPFHSIDLHLYNTTEYCMHCDMHGV